MLNHLQKELNELVNRGLDRTLRIAVTGLSRSGKTAFITSLMNQMLHINRVDNGHLPLFDAARQHRILAVQRVPQLDLSIPRFDYEGNLNALSQEPPIWPQSTRSRCATTSVSVSEAKVSPSATRTARKASAFSMIPL